MPRRPKPSADTRLDWRDPNMPVIGKSGNPINHNKMNIKAEMSLHFSDEPTWDKDPTYNLRKPKP